MKAYFYTFGCKVNQYETENIREALFKRGAAQADKASDADVCIINSCTVTAEADSKCRQMLRRIRKEAPDAVIVLAGCYPQAYGEEVRELGICDIIVGSRNKSLIPDLIEEHLKTGERIVDIGKNDKTCGIEKMHNTGTDKKTRAYIKIQDGCDRYCTYCIIPFARGSICSKTPDEIKKETASLLSSGHKEIILTGINLCRYGKDLGDLTIADAVEAACSCGGEYRVRLSSLEPELLSDRDIERLAAQDKLCPHFHLSLQSGCDETLKRMNRHYTASAFSDIVSKLRKAFPGCAVTTDIMVGFAGETEEEFERSMDFVKRIGFSSAHVFIYSRRKGTAADKFPDQIRPEIQHERAERMRAICKENELRFSQLQIGRTVRVLFERERSPLWHNGHSAEYLNIRVKKTGDESFWRTFGDVKITDTDENGCIGELI